MEAETKEKGTFQPLQGHFLPRNLIYVPNSLIRHVAFKQHVEDHVVPLDGLPLLQDEILRRKVHLKNLHSPFLMSFPSKANIRLHDEGPF